MDGRILDGQTDYLNGLELEVCLFKLLGSDRVRFFWVIGWAFLHCYLAFSSYFLLFVLLLRTPLSSSWFASLVMTCLFATYSFFMAMTPERCIRLIIAECWVGVI